MAGGEGAKGVAVVGLFAGDEVDTLGLVVGDVELAGDFDGGFDRFGALETLLLSDW